MRPDSLSGDLPWPEALLTRSPCTLYSSFSHLVLGAVRSAWGLMLPRAGDKQVPLLGQRGGTTRVKVAAAAGQERATLPSENLFGCENDDTLHNIAH